MPHTGTASGMSVGLARLSTVLPLCSSSARVLTADCAPTCAAAAALLSAMHSSCCALLSALLGLLLR
ncbi:hypothetical protein [Selenomonas artemidis]|uniref:hypothetical protein n=1 Tax=Selenomonas artemidis TaxID=671224 RepID=UPI0028EF0AAD|nr:hypothetical protein [Selenomonas artemidis]